MPIKHLVSMIAGSLLLAGVAMSPSAAADDREPLNASAAHIEAHALTLSGEPSVTVTTVSDNVPVNGLLIAFKSTTLGYSACSAYTNTEGVATCNSGVSFNPLFIVDALASGYNAVFAGNYAYLPFKAHGVVTPAL